MLVLAGRLCWLVLACWAVSIREQGWAWIAWRAFTQNSYCAGCIIAGVMEAADMSLRHAARIYEIIDTRENVGHWPHAKAHLSLQESKRWPPSVGSTDLLVCIGEMCATASPSEERHDGHGRGHQRYDRNGPAT